MGLSKKGKPCMPLKAAVAELISSKTTQACPLSRMLRMMTMSKILPNCVKTALKYFFISASCEERCQASNLC